MIVLTWDQVSSGTDYGADGAAHRFRGGNNRRFLRRGLIRLAKIVLRTKPIYFGRSKRSAPLFPVLVSQNLNGLV